jgi:hypothetical protein
MEDHEGKNGKETPEIKFRKSAVPRYTQSRFGGSPEKNILSPRRVQRWSPDSKGKWLVWRIAKQNKSGSSVCACHERDRMGGKQRNRYI